MAHLRVDARGYPVPWFVAWIDGAPEFRVADQEKRARALRDGLCWVCGERLGRYKAFTIGPMCAVNRTSAEPPGHRDCATYSATACPFLSRPHMRRREGGMPDDTREPPGVAIMRNPGVALVWVTTSYHLQRTDTGMLVRLGPALAVEWYAEGRPATRAEILASIESGLPALRELAEAESAAAVAALERMTAAALELVPAA